jgi:hypothetical protein
MAVPLPDGFEPSPGDDHEAVVHQPWSGKMSTKNSGTWIGLPVVFVSGLKCSIGVLGVPIRRARS